MKEKDIKTYISLQNEIESLCENIFDYVNDIYDDQLSAPNPTFADFEFWNDELTIRYKDYYGNSYRFSLPSIPVNQLDDEKKWKKFIDDHYGEMIKKQEETKKLVEKEREKKERELLKELKKKYEKN